jgi:peptidoglycan/LPS O-acetylase OafA/YrhL
MSVANVADVKPTLLQYREADVALARPASIHLRYLDGFRGLAALYVTLFHAYVNPTYGEPPIFWRPVQAVVNLLMFGHFGVVGFIVLSGYCLSIPFVRRPRDYTLVEVRRFVWRRAWRILPAYYVALLLSMLVLVAYPPMQHPSETAQDLAIPAWSGGTIISHLALVHDLQPRWAYKINTPLWSVATEWQIYFVFILILVPLWRVGGLLTAVVVASVLGIVLARWVPQLASAQCSMLGAFALGMAAAGVSFSSARSGTWLRDRLPWGICSAMLLTATIAILISRPSLVRHQIAADAVIALGCASLMIYCTRNSADYPAADRSQSSLVVRMLECRALVWTGLISYSLYLMHWPILEALEIAATRAGYRYNQVAAITIFTGVPLTLLVGWALHRIVEAGKAAAWQRLKRSRSLR